MKTLIVSIMAILLTTASATIINIPDDYTTIQTGIDSSSDGDTVLVQPGTYVENINFNGHNIVLGSLFLTSADTSYISQTVIDGDSSGSVVIFENGEDSTTTISGFAIENGYSDKGGGIYIWGSGPLIDHNIINSNLADSLGGGIYCLAPWHMIPRVIGNKIENNRAAYGGGINASFQVTEITGNNISNNYALISGGGIYVSRYGGNIINGNFISENRSGNIGGGISFDFDTYDNLFNNNILINNRSVDCGGGIHWNGSNLEINNCVIYGNLSGLGGGLYTTRGRTRVTNTIFWADTATTAGVEIFQSLNSSLNVNYCGIQGGWAGEGNLAVDPLFRDPLLYDFHLQDSIDCGDMHYSPYIDAGNPESLDSLVDCDWGLGAARGDIGAFAGGDSLPHVGVVINVPDDYPTIQEAINASRGRDTVRIAPGTYYERISTAGKNIVIGSHYLINEDTSDIYNTIIDANYSGYVVGMSNNDSTCVLIGLTIRNGIDLEGGGIVIVGGNPIIRRNRIINNTVPSISNAGFGAGICCVSSSAKIIENIVSFNTVEDGGTFNRRGGGIGCRDGGSPEIRGNIITYNSTPDDGGGIAIQHSDSIIILNNYIAYNDAQSGGGVYSQDNEQIIFINNMIIYNSNDGYVGEGNYFYNNSFIRNSGNGLCITFGSPTIVNNVFYRNFSEFGGGLFCDWSSPAIINCIIYSNTPEDLALDNMGYSHPVVRYSNIGASWPGEGNIDIDPLFRDADNADYHLMATVCGDPYDSPCIDMGAPTIIDTLLDCDWGLGTERSDMGAYGGGDGFVGIDEPMENLPTKVTLSQNYPNPFNLSTMIKYELPKQSQVKIDIYDILGRKVSTVEDALQPAGYHQVIWNSEGLPSGVYFYKLQAGDYVETKKMTLIK